MRRSTGRSADYRAALAGLTPPLREALTAAWGAPEDDPCVRGGRVPLRAPCGAGRRWSRLQPERGQAQGREAEYHDLSRMPRHGYVAFYLWLRRAVGVMRWSISARMARWNGCRARRWPCRTPAGPRR